jgi:hypothetical protein
MTDYAAVIMETQDEPHTGKQAAEFKMTCCGLPNSEFLTALQGKAKLEQLLSQHPREEISIFVNRAICSYEEHEESETEFGGHLNFTLPVFLACSFGSAETVELLCDSGADIYGVDSGNVPLIHALCWTAAYKPDLEEKVCGVFRTIMDYAATVEKQSLLLLTSDAEGYRPIELASVVGAYLLMVEILEVEGVYKNITNETSTFRTVTYDVTEYEAEGLIDRHRRSPLNLLLHLTDVDLEKPGTGKIFDHPLFQNWISYKMRREIPSLVISFCWNFKFIVMFTITDETGYRDNTNCTWNGERKHVYRILPENIRGHLFKFFVGVNVFVTFGEITLFLIAVYKNKPFSRPKDITRGTSPVSSSLDVTYALYILSQLVYYILTFVTNQDDTTLAEVRLILRICIVLFAFIMLLFYVQFLPTIGHYVIGFFSCVSTFINFAIIYAIIFFSFAEGFRIVAIYYCVESFGYDLNSYYSTLLVMLNMVDFKALLCGGVPLVVIILHVCAIICLVFLMLNFVIAILSENISNLARYRDIIRQLVRLAGILVMEYLRRGLGNIVRCGRDCKNPSRVVIQYKELIY